MEFIGPSSGPIKAMGDKIESKRIATKAGVNMIPGHDGVVEDVDSCIKYANEIGRGILIFILGIQSSASLEIHKRY